MKQILSTIFLILMFVAASAAQTLSEQAELAKKARESQSIPLDNYIRNENNLPSRTTSSHSVSNTKSGVSPLGANLFSNRSPSNQRAGINPSYIIASGDKISVQLWGAYNLADVYTVDNQGNIFVESVGPIKVQGVFASNLNDTVSQSIRRIYTDNVDIYVNLLASTPVTVFVTGKVSNPGQYAGASSDSILSYLHQAGGISAETGSYRQIDILRNRESVASIDLYAFLLEGTLASHSFQDGDVVIVRDKGDFVIVEQNDHKTSFELTKHRHVGADLIALTQVSNRVSHVAVTGIRNNEAISTYLPLDEFLGFQLASGDELLFNEDIRAQVISVRLSGSFLGPSFYSVDAKTTLHQLLAQVEVDATQADQRSIYILRESVKQQQRVLLEASLSRLERSVFTAPSSSNGEANLRAQEAQLVAQFIDRARKIEPLGKVVVSIDGEVADVMLEQGDEIVIPQRSDLINISGEVMLPQALVFKDEAQIDDYISWAGGFTERAEQAGLVIVHANGLTTIVDNKSAYWFGSKNQHLLKPGDQIIVTPKVNSKFMQTFKDVTQIIYQIAVAANVVTN